MIVTILLSVLALFLYMILAFIVGTIKKNNGLIDCFYGSGYVVIAWTSLLLGGMFSLRQIIITIIVSIWGIRLSLYVTIRNWGKPEDYRYAAMRERYGDRVILKSFFRVYMFQGLIIFLVDFPVLFVNANNNLNLGLIDIIGISIWIIGFYFEAVGDYQLRKFLNDKNRTKKVMDQGLWKYTQHPNYFGEVTMWWGIYVISLMIPLGFVMIFSPVLITFMILKVSGVRLLNKRYEGDGEYADYKRRTSPFIPWFPKKKDTQENITK